VINPDIEFVWKVPPIESYVPDVSSTIDAPVRMRDWVFLETDALRIIM